MRTFFLSLSILGMAACSQGCQKSHTSGKVEASDIATDSLRKAYYLIAGSYTGTGFSVNGMDSGMYVLRMEVTTGELFLINPSPRTENPSYLTVDPVRLLVFAVNETEQGGISSFTLDTATMTLRFINRVSSRGKFPCYICTDPSGKFVLAANYGTGNVASFRINENGSVSNAISTHQHAGNGPNKDRQEGPHAHMIIPGPDGRFLYSTDLGADKVFVYPSDTLQGKLTPAGTVDVSPGAGPRHIAFHPNGQFAYVVNELNGIIEAFLYNNSTGLFTRFQTISTREDGDTRFPGCADIHVHPSGKFLYVTNRGEINTIVLYRINAGDGTLTRAGNWPVEGKTPRNFAISPDGNFLLIANQNTNNIATFRINVETGELTYTSHLFTLPAPVCLKFLPW